MGGAWLKRGFSWMIGSFLLIVLDVVVAMKVDGIMQ